MIRPVRLQDAETIATIYNAYVVNSVATFETEPLKAEAMRARIACISARFPYLVYETGGNVVGFCYAHAWKEKTAYRYTLETTVYISPEHTGKGIGRELMQQLIATCREAGYHILIACITEGNEASCALHSELGFRQASAFEQVGSKFGRWLGVTDYALPLAPDDDAR